MRQTITTPGSKSALIVEGGALRGAYAVGVLRVLHQYGGAEQFNAIYAASSGVFASTYFLAGQVDEMESTWRDRVHGRQLIDYWNVFRRKPILKLDYLIDLFKGPVRLDLDRVFTARPRLTYVLTDWHTGQPSYFDAKRPEIFDLMRASSALPCVYTKRVFVDGRRYVDGGHTDPLPIKKAIADGHTEVVVILTRGHGERKTKNSWFTAALCFSGAPQTKHSFLTVHNVYNSTIDYLERPSPTARITLIRPSSVTIPRLTRDRNTIINAIERGKHDAMEICERLQAQKVGN